MLTQSIKQKSEYLLIAAQPLFMLGCMQPATITEKPIERAVSPTQSYSYSRDIKPILERKCIVCHGCDDAPCQLKLTSPQGLLRDATGKPVCDSARLSDMAPTRLFVDAGTTAEWREKGAH